ncbi:MAG TPA: DUF1934 domain-containing protein [Acetobacterium sp.]|uniref:DUF1934 domain-containing protein n=1 Tax=Acetobacterium sp. TaxID=1872094 RepID=UPI002F412E10
MTEERKKVWVSISGSVKNEEDKDNLEFLTEGDLYKESDGACVTYEESEVSGMEGTVTTLRVDKQKVSVIRLGTTNSIMEFESGKRNLTWYSTPFGDVTMGILTKDVLVNYNDLKEPTKVMIDYNIEIEGITNSQNVLNIKITQ